MKTESGGGAVVFRYCLVLLLTVGAAGMDLRTQKIYGDRLE